MLLFHIYAQLFQQKHSHLEGSVLLVLTSDLMWSILRFMQESSHSSSLLSDTYSFISINTHDSFLFSFPFVCLFQ